MTDEMDVRADIVVVGAGPAGSMAARAAAERDSKVVLLEEHPIVGEPIYCAEGLSLQGLRDAGLKPEKDIVSQKILGARYFAPNGEYIDVKHDEWVGYTLNRPIFDRALAEKAVEAGADLMLKTRATDVTWKNGRIVGVKAKRENEELHIEAKVVIGADGYASTIRRCSGFERWFSDVTSCAQYHMTGIKLKDPDFVEFHIGEKYAPGGYAWVFPKSEKAANVGLGVRKKHKEPALEYLKRFVSNDPRFEKADITKISGGICPVSGILNKIVENGLILVGDAAGELIPNSGAGIHTAVVSGKISGKVAAEAINEGDVTQSRLSEYRKLFETRFGKLIRDGRRAIELLDRLTDNDLNTLAKIVKKEDVISLADGINVTQTLARLFIRSPRKMMKIILGQL